MTVKKNVLVKTGLTTLALGGAVLAYASLVERNRFTLLNETVAVLPKGARPITILHISDIHLAPWQNTKIEWLRSLRVMEPDLVINTGDNMGHPDAFPTLLYSLEGLIGYPGAFVDGSNDFYAPVVKNPLRYLFKPKVDSPVIPLRAKKIDPGPMHQAFEDLGWVDLNNRATELEIKGTVLKLVGTDDAHHGAENLAAVPKNLAALNKTPGKSSVTIGVTHAPYQRVLNSFTANGADIIFAGHTHGGQVCIPGKGAIVSNCDLPPKQASGLSRWSNGANKSWLHVSSGLGTSIFAPVRFACPPSATLITLVPVS